LPRISTVLIFTILLLLTSSLRAIDAEEAPKSAYILVGIYGGKYVNEKSLYMILNYLRNSIIRIDNITWRIKVRIIKESDILLKQDTGLLYDVIILPDGDLSKYASSLTVLRNEIVNVLKHGGGFIGIGAGAYIVTKDILYPGAKELKYTGWSLIDARTYAVTYTGNITLRLTKYGNIIFNKTTTIFNKTSGYVFESKVALPLAIVNSASNASGNVYLVIGYPAALAYENATFRVVLIGFIDISRDELLQSVAYVSGIVNASYPSFISMFNQFLNILYDVPFAIPSSSLKMIKSYLNEAISNANSNIYYALYLFYCAKDIFREHYLQWLSYREKIYLIKHIASLSLIIIGIMSSFLALYIYVSKKKHLKGGTLKDSQNYYVQ